jgi:hypothetical protein
MEGNVDTFLQLVDVLAWPLVVVLALILFRRPLIELVGAIARRARKVTIYQVSIELATLRPMTPSWSVPELDVRRLSPALLIDSYTETLFRQVAQPPDAEYAVIDLRAGEAWLTSRLFIFAIVLGEITGLRTFVFLEKSGLGRKTFVGVATPSAVRKALGTRYPWFEEAFIRAATPASPPVQPADVPGNSRFTGTVGLTLFPTSEWSTLKHIARSYVDILQRNTDPPELEKRDHLQLDTDPTWEKTRWITGDLLEQLLGEELSDTWCEEDLDKSQSALVESILKRNADFVALVDRRQRFRGLVDRKALAIETVSVRTPGTNASSEGPIRE